MCGHNIFRQDVIPEKQLRNVLWYKCQKCKQVLEEGEQHHHKCKR
jgi:hypothetical protein